MQDVKVGFIPTEEDGMFHKDMLQKLLTIISPTLPISYSIKYGEPSVVINVLDDEVVLLLKEGPKKFVRPGKPYKEGEEVVVHFNTTEVIFKDSGVKYVIRFK